MKKIYLIIIGILGSLFIYIKGEKNGTIKQKAKQSKKVLKKVSTKTKVKKRITSSSTSSKLLTRD